MPNIAFHIYGPVEEDFDLVYESIGNLKNVFYHGIFRNIKDSIYGEITKYNVVLLPARWGAEGVPGILVESKIAGVPVIVSNICYNTEIVHNGKDGIVIEPNSAEELKGALEKLYQNTLLQEKLIKGAKEDASRYYIENYVDGIIKIVNDKNFPLA